MKKKILSLLLAVVMLAGMMITSVSAADEINKLSSNLIYGSDIAYKTSSGDYNGFYYIWNSNSECNKNSDGLSTFATSKNITYWGVVRAQKLNNQKLGFGNYAMSAQFMFETPTGTYLPIYLQGNSSDQTYRYGATTVMVRNGAMYACVYSPSNISVTGNGEWPGDTASGKHHFGVANRFEKICDIDSSKWYTIKITYNIDGNSETWDTYSYNVTDGVNTYSGGPYKLGMSAWSGSVKVHGYDMTELSSVYLGCSIASDSSSNVKVSMKNFNWIDPNENFTVTQASATDGQDDVMPDKAVQLTFSHEIGDISKNFVTLKSGSTVIPANIALSSDNKSMTIIPETGAFNENTNYTITIPKNFASKECYAIDSAKTITFTTGKALEYIFENSGTLPALSDTGNGGFYWKGSWTDGYKPTAITTEDGRTAVQMPGKASISSGSNIPNWRTTTALGTGNYVVEGTFKMINQVAQYYPITFHTDLTTNVNRQIKTVWAEGGKLWAKAADAPNSLSEIYSPGKIEICNLDSTKWYDIKISVNCDGDASTVDTYSYSITDGTNSYTGGPYAFGQAINDSQQGQYDATSIVSVGFGTCGKANGVEGLTYIDRLAAYKNAAMTNPTAKSNLDGVSITFDEAINSRSLTSVSLYKTKEESTKIPAVFSLSADGKTLNVNAEGLDFSSEYTVKIPKNVVSVNNKSLADVYKTAFSTGNAATAAEISNAICSGALTPGNIVNVTADCKNTSGVKAQIKLCAQVQDSEGNVLGSAYTDSVYNDGEAKSFKASLKVPEGAAKIALYATAANGDPITSYVIQ